MAPVRQRDPSIERTDEYEEFIKRLEEYHEKRGYELACRADCRVSPDVAIGLRWNMNQKSATGISIS
jgi:hypothetical protein